MRLFKPREFEVNRSIPAIKQQLAGGDTPAFRIILTRKGEYKFLANFSLGTIIRKGGASSGNGININARFTSVDQHRTKVTLISGFRYEYLILIIFWAIEIIWQFTGKEKAPIVITLVLFPCVFLFFRLVHGLQESALKDHVEAYLTEP